MQTFLGVHHVCLLHERLLNQKINSFPIVCKYQLEITCRLSENQSALLKSKCWKASTYVRARGRVWNTWPKRLAPNKNIKEISVGVLYISPCKGWIRCHLLIKLFCGWGNGGVLNVNCNWTKGNFFSALYCFVVKLTSVEQMKHPR